MNLSLSVLYFILLCLILISAFFSAAEIGMMSLNRYKLRHLVKKNNKKALLVHQLLAHPDKLLSVVLIGNTLANIVASTVATLIGQRLYGDWGVACATGLLTLVILMFAEMIPKTLAALRPQPVAFATVYPLLILQYLLSPFIFFVTTLSSAVLTFFGLSIHKTQREALTREELRSVVHEVSSVLPVEHKGMLLSVIDLESACMKDIMILKEDIVGINLEWPWSKVIEMLETAQHTRLPVFYGDLDHLVGLIHLRKILNISLTEPLTKEMLLKQVESPYFVPEGTPLNVQIFNFQKMKRRSCFVVDEYGDLQGLATLEDILEEIVGDFTTDIADFSKEIMIQSDGSVIIDASVTLRSLHRTLSWTLPMLGPRTLSGLIIEYLGYIPPAECCLVLGDFRIEILSVADHMIRTVRMEQKN